MSKKKILALTILAIIVIGTLVALWNSMASRTRIGFVNYQAITLGQISKANDNSMVRIEEIPLDEIDKIKKYDMVFVNGMGLRIDGEQRDIIVKAAENGVPVITTQATNPANQIVSVDSIDNEYLKQYLTGGRNNYRNMLRYVRKFVDGKKFFIDEPSDPVLSSSSLLYYPSDKEDLMFDSVAEYEEWLKKNGKWNDKAPRIIVTGQMGVPDSLFSGFERTGNMVYGVTSPQIFITRGHADSIKPAAIINMAHGRLGDMVVEWLNANNIPLFSTVNANRDYHEWMDDNMGMAGGFLSQSIVTPEIDGAIRPYTLFAQFDGDDGIPYVDVIPDRFHDFVETVNNYVSLQDKPNKDKKLAVFYFKGPGQSSLVAEGMDVVPSLYNFLTHLKNEGYNVDGMPANAQELGKLIEEKGKVFNDYAVGAKEDFVRTANPLIITRTDYEQWDKSRLGDEMLQQIDAVDGDFPGHAMHDEKGNLALARLQFGNVVLIPQPAAGLGDDDFRIVHGTDVAPPHEYVAAYLWARDGFDADALIHFGAHGSLEFTPRKQVALGSTDWSDRLVGTLPHVYAYSTSNVGEAMTAKRRSYAGIVNYLTPPFKESNLRGTYKELTDALNNYNTSRNETDSVKAAKKIKDTASRLGILRDLRIDSLQEITPTDIARIENFAQELVNEKITGRLYVMGEPYSTEDIASTVEAMTIDPIAYSLQKLRGGDINKYRTQAKQLLTSGTEINDETICRLGGLTREELDSARRLTQAIEGSKDMLSRMMVMAAMTPPSPEKALKISERPETKKHRGMIPGMSPEKALEMAKKMGASDEALKKMEAALKKKSVVSSGGHGNDMTENDETGIKPQELEFATAVSELEQALRNIGNYRELLENSPRLELAAITNALDGGYIAPTPGGDPVLNPNVLPTGRNMFAINAEETPSLAAWEKGKSLAENTLAMYAGTHSGALPQKVSYTLWSSEFIETEGATIAQILYMLGVEPVRDTFGRVTDLRLIPSERLGRSRIDVMVQTSGQLRDLAASRLFLIDKAVKMAANAEDDIYPNYVREGVVESERHLVQRGLSPKEARELSSSRVFGGINGNYGSGIQSMVEAGDRWETEDEIAANYINNMGAMYGSEADWEKMREFVFEAALTNTDVVVQPRQSNTWGALSLDHVYEFMGGLNLAVRNVTGKDPEAYLSDYRNRNNVRMQEVKEAIGVESRTTILNPAYIREKMKGGAGDAASISDVIKNTYGWNVMKPDAIDNELWNDIYDTYISDNRGLGVKDYFKDKNPAALQEMTAVMLETIRKGMWKANKSQIETLAELHTELIDEFGAACTGFVCDNAKLKDFISSNVSDAVADKYKDNISRVRAENMSSDEGMVMKREELNNTDSITNHINGIAVGIFVIVALIGIILLVRIRRKKQD